MNQVTDALITSTLGRKYRSLSGFIGNYCYGWLKNSDSDSSEKHVTTLTLQLFLQSRCLPAIRLLCPISAKIKVHFGRVNRWKSLRRLCGWKIGESIPFPIAPADSYELLMGTRSGSERASEHYISKRCPTVVYLSKWPARDPSLCGITVLDPLSVS